MRIGYACLALGVPHSDFRSCLLKNATNEKLQEITAYNLTSLRNLLDYNIQNQISLFRISSDVIPFGSHEVNRLPWDQLFREEFHQMSTMIVRSGMRVSMHPGQYTVLNSPNKQVVERAVEDLTYHAKVLDLLGAGATSKIILHLGGVYGDKRAAIERFVENYKVLNDQIKSRMVIENDDKSYHIGDVLEVADMCGIPVVYDTLHNKINPYKKEKDDRYWIEKCASTWKEMDGVQKIHFSLQHQNKTPGSHSDTIWVDEFIGFYQTVKDLALDIMLEVKDKNMSALKCRNCIIEGKEIKELEKEWGRYKYLILEKDQSDYLAIRKLLKEKSKYPVNEFYQLTEHALQQQTTIGNAKNAIQHVWGYFKNVADEKEKKRFLLQFEQFQKGKIKLITVKKYLYQLSERYQEDYLLKSYFFKL